MTKQKKRGWGGSQKMSQETHTHTLFNDLRHHQGNVNQKCFEIPQQECPKIKKKERKNERKKEKKKKNQKNKKQQNKTIMTAHTVKDVK